MYQPYFHVGVLVRDLDVAAATFAARLGIDFEPVRTGTLATGDRTRYCYSLQGPPFIELMQMTGEGAFRGPDEGLHHVGYYETDLPGRCALFDGPTEPLVRTADGAPLVCYTDPADLHGVRLEFLAPGVGSRAASSVS